MQLINTDGLALIGPGSEWFWAMLTMVMLTITFVAIYRQLRAQVAANALQKMLYLAERWDSDWMTHARLSAALHLKHGMPGRRMSPAMLVIGDFFEDVEGLRADGNLRLRDVESWSYSIQMWWALLAPAIQAERVIRGIPIYEGWEGLSQLMRAYGAKAGRRPFQVDATTIPGLLDGVIDQTTGRLQMAHDVKSGVIPSAPAAAAASSSATGQ